MPGVRDAVARSGSGPSTQLSSISVANLRTHLNGLTLDTIEDLEYAELVRRIIDLRADDDGGWTYGSTYDAITATVLTQTLDRTSLSTGGDDTWGVDVVNDDDAYYNSHAAGAPDQAPSLSLDASTSYEVEFRGGYVRGTGAKAVTITLVENRHNAIYAAPGVGDYGHLWRFFEGSTNNNQLHFAEYLGVGGDNDAMLLGPEGWIPLTGGGGWQITLAAPEQNKSWKFGAQWRWRRI